MLQVCPHMKSLDGVDIHIYQLYYARGRCLDANVITFPVATCVIIIAFLQVWALMRHVF